MQRRAKARGRVEGSMFVKWGLTREQSKDCSLYFASLIY